MKFNPAMAKLNFQHHPVFMIFQKSFWYSDWLL